MRTNSMDESHKCDVELNDPMSQTQTRESICIKAWQQTELIYGVRAWLLF